MYFQLVAVAVVLLIVLALYRVVLAVVVAQVILLQETMRNMWAQPVLRVKEIPAAKAEAETFT
jgi:hypothetical protein